MSDILIAEETFVQREYFIERVFVFERKYRNLWKGWSEFLESYEAKDALIDENNLDLDEWAFLCHEFRTDLLLAEIRQHAPPSQTPTPKTQKPESDSGFYFWS